LACEVKTKIKEHALEHGIVDANKMKENRIVM